MKAPLPAYDRSHTSLTYDEWNRLCKECKPQNGFLYDEEANTIRKCSCLETVASRRGARSAATEEQELLRMAASLDTPPVISLKPTLREIVQRFGRNVGKCVDEGRGLWFEGTTSTGKTVAACAIGKTAHHRGLNVGRWIVPELLGRLRRTYDENDSETCQTLVRKIVNLDVLVLDDLGAERQSEWVVEQLYLILNGRWERARLLGGGGSLIVTTNLTVAELEQQLGRFGPPIVSRLHSLCDRPLHFEGLDHRREEARDLEEITAARLDKVGIAEAKG